MSAILDAAAAENAKHLTLISRHAIVKRIDLEDIRNIRSSGLIVMKPKDSDSLGWVRATTGADKILIVSSKGKAIQFNEEDVRVMGRGAAGVRGMRLGADDSVIEADMVRSEDRFVFTITSHGM